MAVTEKNERTLMRLLIKMVGLVMAGLFGTMMVYSLVGLNEGLFHANNPFAFVPFDYTLLAGQIGSFLWTFRVFDLLLLLPTIFLTIICGHFLVTFKTGIERREDR